MRTMRTLRPVADLMVQLPSHCDMSDTQQAAAQSSGSATRRSLRSGRAGRRFSPYNAIAPVPTLGLSGPMDTMQLASAPVSARTRARQRRQVAFRTKTEDMRAEAEEVESLKALLGHPPAAPGRARFTRSAKAKASTSTSVSASTSSGTHGSRSGIAEDTSAEVSHQYIFSYTLQPNGQTLMGTSRTPESATRWRRGGARNESTARRRAL